MKLLDLIFPKSCLVCKSRGSYICSTCIKKVSTPKPICPECQKSSIDGFTHIRCQKRYSINGLTSIWRYEGVIRQAIIALKYKYATEIIKELQSYIVKDLQSKKDILGENIIIIPIPLFWYRENFRGFNQSEGLGRVIAKEMRWKHIPDLIVRNKHTKPQVTLKGKDRRQNLKDVFIINTHYSSLVPHHSFILFDDVYTTGSTLKEAVKVLKRAGAQKVWGLTLAR